MAKTQKARLWARRIAAFERSGLSRRMWCAGQGLNSSSLDYWRTRLGSAQAAQRTQANSPRSATTPVVVPLVVEPAHTRGAGIQAQVEIDLPGGVRLQVAPGVDVVWLTALLRGVAGC